MNKSWDSNKGGRDQWIAWLASIMREALRTLKPGGHCLVWALPRTSHWAATALENAGFEIRDVMHHMYSADTVLHDFLASLNAEQHEAFERLVESQGSSVLYSLFGQGFPKSLDVSKSIDAHYKSEREVVGYGSHAAHRHSQPYGQGAMQDECRDVRAVTAPASDAAKQWVGFGTALKPAAEHWILCRKSLSERSIAENVLRWGTGSLAIDASRVPYKSEADAAPKDYLHSKGVGTYQIACKEQGARKYAEGFSYLKNDFVAQTHPIGRFPANLMLSHSLFCTEERCADGCPILSLDQQSGTRKSGAVHSNGRNSIFGNGSPGEPMRFCDDKGTASRYFAQFRPDAPPFYYASKASRRERNAGLDNLAGSEGKTPDAPAIEKNHHPCVKSLSLMQYLIKLVTPPSGVVLDMFCGSGSTLCAAIYEQCHFIGIEQSEEYCAIAEARVAHAQSRMRSEW